jgi:hypothetical protein
MLHSLEGVILIVVGLLSMEGMPSRYTQLSGLYEMSQSKLVIGQK